MEGLCRCGLPYDSTPYCDQGPREEWWIRIARWLTPIFERFAKRW